MSEFITLSCPSCNGKLQITEDIDRFACIHCGNEHVVKRGGGIVSLKPVLEQMSKGVDSTASELALVRLDKEIAEVEKRYLPLKGSVDAAGSYLAMAILAGIVGVVSIIVTDCVAGGVILIIVGLFLLIGYTSGQEKKAEKNELEEKLNKLKASRQEHYDRVNNG
jgi:hypothetical protein